MSGKAFNHTKAAIHGELEADHAHQSTLNALNSFGADLGRAEVQQAKAIEDDPDVKLLLDMANSFIVADSIFQELTTLAVFSRDAGKGRFSMGSGLGVMDNFYEFSNPRGDLVQAQTALMQIQGRRTRIVEIQIGFLSGKARLERAATLVTEVVYEKYAHKIAKLPRDAAHKKAFMGQITRKLDEKLEVINEALEIIEAALSNLDRAHFTYKSAIDVGTTILSRMEGRPS